MKREIERKGKMKKKTVRKKKENKKLIRIKEGNGKCFFYKLKTRPCLGKKNDKGRNFKF